MMGVYVKRPPNKVLAVIIIVIIVISGVIVTIGGSSIIGSEPQELQFQILANTTSVMVGESILFEADVTTGSAQAWLWDLGDGSISINDTVTHTYQRSARYNVSLVVIGDDGQNITEVLVVEVQNHDIQAVETGDIIAYPTRNYMPWDLIYFDLHDGITRPNITARWSGTCASYQVGIFLMMNGGDVEFISEAVDTGTGTFEILREVSVGQEVDIEGDYIMVLQANGGAITNYRLELTVEY
jgi:hypothetical protein